MIMSKKRPHDTAAERGDPFPYKGPLRRVDGRAPFNHYLWPLGDDWFWAYNDLGRRFSSTWNFSAVALADGRWIVEGFVKDDEFAMEFFPSRETALRTAAARLIRMIRRARRWTGHDHVSAEDYPILIAWTLETIGRPAREVFVAPPPPPPPPAPPTTLLEIMERVP